MEAGGGKLQYLLIRVCLGSLLLLGALHGCLQGKEQVIDEIIPEEAYRMIKEHESDGNLIVIDIRTPEEFAEEHIAGAENIDYYSESFREEIDRLDKDKAYVIYCRSGRRSGEALKIFRELGFREVHNMLWGIVAWKKDGFPVTREHQ